MPAARVDVAIAVVLFALGAVEAVGIEDLRGPLLVNLLLLGVICASLAWRRRRPLAAILTIVAAAILQAAVATDASEFAATFAALLLVSFSVAAYGSDREAFGGLVAVLGLVAVVNALAETPMTLGDYLFPGGLALCCWLAGRAVRHRSRLTEAMHELAVRAEEDREAHRRAVVADERRRLAREMHDIVAHSISVMVVQAGGARRILDRDPERAAQGWRRSSRPGARRSWRCAACWASCGRPTSAPSARRSQGSTCSTPSSSAHGPPGCRWRSTSRASAARCPAASTSLPTVSCRRR